MTKLRKTARALAAITLAAPAFAIPMGEIKSNLDTSEFAFDNTRVDFDQSDVQSGIINDASGDFSGIIGEKVLYKDFVYDPFSETGITDLWEVVDSGISFSLVDLIFSEYSVVGDGAFLNLLGEGWLHVDGEEDVWASWSLSADEVDGVFNFSSSTTTATAAVSDPVATHALLGLGIFGIVALSSRFKRAKQLS